MQKIAKFNKYLNDIAFDRIIVGLIASIVFMRLWGNGFTSGDDGYIAVARYRFGGVFQAAFALASSQGRFYQLVIFPIAQLPYLFDSIAVTNIFRILSSAFPVLVFYKLLKEIYGELNALFFIGVYLVFFDSVGDSYNPFHGLPMWFNLGLGFYFLSLMFYVKGLKDNRSAPAMVGLYYFFSLMTYEPMILLSFAYLAIHMRFNSQAAWGVKFLEAVKHNYYIIFTLFLYITLYVLYKAYFPGSYEGVKFSLAPLPNMIYPMVDFTIHGLYWKLSFHKHSAISITSLLITILFLWQYIRVINSREIDKLKFSWLGIFTIFILSLLPNVLYGFTQRYRDWPTHFYLGSYYSAFALAILLGLFLIAIHRYLKWATCFVLLLLVLLIGYSNQKQSEVFFNEAKNRSNKWAVARLEVPFIKNFPEL